MTLSQIQAFLGSHPWADRIHVFPEVGSTNTLAKELAANGAPHGTVLIADRQSAGRGRLGRSFLSPGGVGIYLSVLLRPNCPPQNLMHLTCAVAVAMCDAVEQTAALRPGIKWTNDLVVSRKKLGGILTELVLDPKTGLVSAAIVGIGINCRQKPEDFDPAIQDMACSVEMVTGTPCSRAQLAAAMIHALEQLDLSSKEKLLSRYRADCVTLGQPISILRGDQVSHATALDIDSDGGLIVRMDSGETVTVSSGEVSVRGFYGYV